MVVPFMTLYLTSPEMGYSIGQAGFVFGLFGAGAFTGAWLGGKLTDRVGFYPIQITTLIGGGILFLVLGQMKTFPLICIFTFLLSFVNEAFRPANSTAIAFYSTEKNRTRSYSLNRLAINLGWAAGGALGGLLAHINYELLFWVDGFTNIGAGLLMWFMLRPAKSIPAKAVTGTAKGLPAHRDKVYMYFILITVFFASCFFQLFTNLPVFFKRDMHLSEPYIGLLMAINGIIIALTEMVLVYKLEGRRNNLVYIAAGVFITGISFLLLNLPVNYFLLSFLMIVVVSLGEIIAMPFMSSYWITRSQASNRGQYAALFTMSWSLAQTFGPFAGALAAEHWGFYTLWWITGGICLMAALSFRLLYKTNY